jgi:hypothetical protein
MKKMSEKTLMSLIPKMVRKLPEEWRPTYRIAAAAFSKRGNLLGIEMNGWRELATTRRGTGKHAEAALIKKYGRKIETIYILRIGNAGDILPIHPCEACKNMADKAGITIVPMHELLGLC